MTERIDDRIGQTTGDKVEGEVEVGEREEREHELHELVDEFDVEEDLAPDGMVSCPYLLEMKQ